MSDSEEDGESGGVNLTGFLFGNINIKTGQLEDDLLDDDSKKHLNALQKLGLGNIMNEVMEGEKSHIRESRPTRSRISYDSESDDDDYDPDDKDSEGHDGGHGGNMNSSSFPDSSDGSGAKRGDSLEDDDYDDIKSPSAVDFSDITELADEDFPCSTSTKSTSRKMTDDTDYDADSDGDDTLEKALMPPPTKLPVGANKLKLRIPSGSGLNSVSSQNNVLNGDSSGEKKLETPLAAMMPSKYAGIDVSEIFPDFRAGRVLRFSRLFGPGKSSSLPQVWKNVKKRRKKKRVHFEGESIEDKPREKRGWNFIYGPEPDENECVTDAESILCERVEAIRSDDDPVRKERNDGRSGHANIWRHGPAQLWYDMMHVPEEDEYFDYGFKPKRSDHNSKSSDESDLDEEENGNQNLNGCNGDAFNFPDESFHMVTQLKWESNIIWDGNDCKYKKLNKNKAAGWVPSGVNRTAQNFSQTGKGSPGTPNMPGVSGKSGVGGASGGGTGSSFASTNMPPPPPKMQKASTKTEEGGLSGQQGDDTWYSIFPVETSELVYGCWEDEVIWDCEEMDKIPEPKILALDPNDENIVLCIPDDVDPNASQGTTVPVKVKIPHPHVKKSKILLGKAGVINVIEEDSPPPSPKNDDKDPYNISNDEYYQSKFTEQSLLKISASGNIIQHSTPVVELRAPFIPTHMGQLKLRNFHRPALRKYNNGIFAYPAPQPVLPLTKHIKKKQKQREQERLAAGGGDIFFMRTPDDLSGKDGELILMEYCEEHPPLLNQVGMCAKIKNYYKRKAGKDAGPPESKYGETSYAHTSPFLGAMHPGQIIQTLENNMYRTPVYEHPVTGFDFLVIRTRTNYFIREFDGIFTAGQECPLYEVPGPNSKRANNFVRDFLQVFIYRLFWKSRDNPRRIRMEEIKRAFPMHSESSIRKRLKLCADFKRTGADSNWWVIKPEFRLPTEEEIRAMVSPEQCCAYLSLIAAEQRLKDAGYGEKFLFAPEGDDDDENQGKIDDEVKTAPWNTTRAYILAMRGKCLLQLLGPADPTGCGEGFSYIRVPNKPQTNKEEQEAQPKRIVTGTDADLRRLSLNNAKALLRKFGVPEEEIKKLSRWEVIDVVRTLSTEKAKAGEKGMNKFSRGNRFSVAEHQERYKEECQRIFELQNRVLQSGEVLSTDEGESSEEELSDIEEMGKNIENMLSNKKTSSQLNHEKEEQERRELQKMIMGEGKEDREDERGNKKSKKKDDEDNNTLSGLANHPGRVLKIHRTFKSADGKEYTRTEIVRKPAIIDIYMRIRTTKDEAFIRQFALLDDHAKEEMKKEKRRIQEQLRRIKRNQEKETTKPPTPRKKKIKLKPQLKMKCGACGQVGHMKTNKACPLYQNTSSPVPSLNVAMTQEQEEEIEKELFVEDEELVKVDGTKVHLSGKLVQHAEEIKRRSLMLKVPKDLMTPAGKPKKKRPAPSVHCDYLAKKRKTANRQRIDPMVVISGIFEAILNELRALPDSNHFHLPVSNKIPDYYRLIKKPMDLQTMRDKVRQKKYQTRSDFLTDVQLILDNCSTYNGPKNLLTEYARKMLDLCKDRLQEKEEKFIKLERMINPLLDDNDQTGLSYILENAMNKIKAMPDAFPFLKPVNKKAVKDYYEIISSPMDLETIYRKIKGNKYHNRFDFLNDLDLIRENSLMYNGVESTFTNKAASLVGFAKEYLEQFDEHLGSLEINIQKAKDRAIEDGDSSYSFAGIDDELSNSHFIGMEGDTTVSDTHSNTSRGAEIEELDDYYNTNVLGMGRSQSRDEEEEEGEYLSEEELALKEKMRHDNIHLPGSSHQQSLDEDSQQAMEALLQLSSRPGSNPMRGMAEYGDENIHDVMPERNEMSQQNLHADLEVSDSDNEGDRDVDPPDDDGLWF